MIYEDDEEIDGTLAKCRDFLRRAKTHSSQWRQESIEDYGFYSGTGQWDEESRAKLMEQQRPVITFNRIGPVVDAVSGSEVANRQEVAYLPRTQGDVQPNEILTAAADWARDQCDAMDEESDAFLDTIICGMGWTETRISYDEDPEGRICIDRVDPLEMYWDPAAKKRNLSDAKELARVKRMSKREVMDLWPDAKIDFTADDIYSDLGEDEESEPKINLPGDEYKRKQEGSQREEKKLKVIEYQWAEKTHYYRVLDVNTGQMQDIAAEDFKKLNQRAEKAGVPFKSVKSVKMAWKRAFIIGSTIVEEGDAPCPESSTFKCITGKRDRNTNTWYGLVRAMKDPQRWANKWLSQVLHIVNSNAKGGLLAEKDAFDNPRQAEESWSDPAAITFLRPGALSQGKVQPKSPITWPAGLDKLMEFAITSIRDVTGVNLELLGMADRQQAGVLEYQRKQAGMTILATMFDGLRRYRKEQGRVLLYFIQEYIPEGTLIRIVTDTGNEQYVPLAKDKSVTKFDVVVDDAPTSPNQKEKTWQILTAMLPGMADKMTPNMWSSLLEYSPLPSSLVSDLQEQIQQAGAVPPEVQEQVGMMQAELGKLQEENQKLKIGAEQKAAELQLKLQEFQVNTALKEREILADFQIESMKAQNQIQLERQKATQGLVLEASKARMHGELEKAKLKAQDAPLMEGDIDMLLVQDEKKLQELMAQNNQSLSQLSESLSQSMQMFAQSMQMLAGAMEKMSAPKRARKGADGSWQVESMMQ